MYLELHRNTLKVQIDFKTNEVALVHHTLRAQQKRQQ